jgi:hypothetical protein
MAGCCNTKIIADLPTDPHDISIVDLLDTLDAHGAKPLVFTYGGRTIRSGYHITEVKVGRFDALDCGANPESWAETFVQLWDVEGDRAHMPAWKFASIIRKVSSRVALDPTTRLTFEVSDGEQPMQLHRAALPVVAGGTIRLALSPRAASCKPRDKWIAAQEPTDRCCPPQPRT